MSATATVPKPVVDVESTSARPGAVWLRALLRKPLAVISATYLIVLVAAVLIVPLLPGVNPGRQDLAHVLSGPSAQHWLGTDQLGRDIGLRLLAGGRSALFDVLIAVAAFLISGVPLAIIAGYRGGWIDRAVMRLADLLFSVPAIVVLLMVVAVFPDDDPAAMIALGVLSCPGLLRIVRGVTAATRGELYVTAARLSGLRERAILRRHILPSLAGPIIVQVSLFCAGTLIAESGLSFLGLLRPDTSGPTWGNMVADAANSISQDSWFLVPTGGIIALTVLAFSLLGDAIRDVTVGQGSAAVPVLRARRRSATSAVSDRAAMPGAEPALLRLTGVTVASAGSGTETTILDDVSLSVACGEAVGLVGESGCGKTITAKAVLGLLPAGVRQTGGSIRFDGMELTGMSDAQQSRVRGSGIALVSQDPINSLDPTFTVGSQLREVIRTHHELSRAEADARAVELLNRVRLPDPASVLRRRVHELSGGMAQRVGIALALAGDPKLLIADEPTTALDVTVQADILELLRDLRRELGMALILVTHDWGVLADICDRTLVMYAGEIIEVATTERIYQGPRHPYSAALLASNPQLTAPGRPLPTIPGSVPPPSAWPVGCHFQDRCRYAVPACAKAPVPLTVVDDGHLARCIRVEELEGQL